MNIEQLMHKYRAAHDEQNNIEQIMHEYRAADAQI